MKDRKVHVNKKTSFDFGKNEHHMLSGLGGRFDYCSQAEKQAKL